MSTPEKRDMGLYLALGLIASGATWLLLSDDKRERIKGAASDALDAIAESLERRRLADEFDDTTDQVEAAELPVLDTSSEDSSGSSGTTRLSIEQWLRVILHPTVVLILGPRGTGKSALGYWLLELLRYVGPCYVVGVPDSARGKLPGWIGTVANLEELPPESIALQDEAYLPYSARASSTEANQKLSAILNLARQRKQTLIFVTQEARQIDINVTSAADVVVVRAPGALQSLTERRELGPIMAKAREAFTEVAGDRREWAFVRGVTSDFEALLPAKLPTFWSEEISTLFADQAPAAPNAHPKSLTLYEKIQVAVELRRVGISYREIARRFNVSVGTAYNWVNNFPYAIN